MNGLVIFIIVFFSLVFLGVSVFIIYMLGRKSARNNTEKAIVMQLNGNDVASYSGSLYDASTPKGLMYKFGRSRFVTYPKKYKQIFHKGKMLIFINHRNQFVASPFDKDIELSETEKTDLIYEMVSGHVGADGMRALKGKSGGNMVLIAIIAFIIGGLVVFGANYVINMKKEQNIPAQTQQTTQQTTDNTTINENNAVRVEHGQ